jgi:hypothetical protein
VIAFFYRDALELVQGTEGGVAGRRKKRTMTRARDRAQSWG